MNNKQRVWGIRSGEQYFDATELFIRQSYVGIGWSAAGELLGIGPNQQKIRTHLEETHTHDSSITARRFALGGGDLYRFLYEAQIGDIIVYHCKDENSIYVGTIIGSYQYNTEMHQNAPHLRQVQWHSIKPRQEFSAQPRKEMGRRGPTFWEMQRLQEFVQLAAE